MHSEEVNSAVYIFSMDRRSWIGSTVWLSTSVCGEVCKQPLHFISFITSSFAYGSHRDEKRAADGDSEIGLNVSSLRVASQHRGLQPPVGLLICIPLQYLNRLASQYVFNWWVVQN